MVSVACTAEGRASFSLARRCDALQDIFATADEECLHLLLLHDRRQTLLSLLPRAGLLR